ncbi:RES domain-containing protein [Cupriavidus necator]|uniref:RES domain-containing protein n=3 Tax=Burkholderiaceae TaxID=119060 RepID=A0A7Z7JGB5_9BURK|nr:RES domain-containing protein [Cupriavidus necator]SOZ18605.1 conserved hypothetical protein [Cupriavidus taiwanensis]SOZ96736.1 conserved hypothetical protein [Cupriavidus taiwanensis]SPC26065.1 conserved hypothetical protein [Cupriavidus taiwanensis]
MSSGTKGLFHEFMLEGERAEPTWVCADCVDDRIVKMLASELFERRVCSGCNSATINAMTPKRIAEFIGKHLPNHFEPDYGLYPGYERTLDEVVGEAIGCRSDFIRRAVSECLEDASAAEEDFYCPGQEYRRTGSPFDSEEHERWYVVGAWHRIADELTHGQRFFNDGARSFFEGLIDEALNATDPKRPGTPALVTIHGVGTRFYRSRIADSAHEAKSFADSPDVALGAAPKERAANNRMSPAGIPLLYVSRELDTCIAEVRPSIGDTVVVGQFQSTEPLKFFDFTALNRWLKHEPLSLFDPNYQKRSEYRLLLRYLHEEISRPVRANDTDYVVTQALAEFIRYEKNWSFDGIAFQSVQRKGGVNYALFDRGAPEHIHRPEWRPTFHLSIESDAVTVHVVDSVDYRHKVATEAGLA